MRDEGCKLPIGIIDEYSSWNGIVIAFLPTLDDAKRGERNGRIPSELHACVIVAGAAVCVVVAQLHFHTIVVRVEGFLFVVNGSGEMRHNFLASDGIADIDRAKMILNLNVLAHHSRQILINSKHLRQAGQTRNSRMQKGEGDLGDVRFVVDELDLIDKRARYVRHFHNVHPRSGKIVGRPENIGVGGL